MFDPAQDTTRSASEGGEHRRDTDAAEVFPAGSLPLLDRGQRFEAPPLRTVAHLLSSALDWCPQDLEQARMCFEIPRLAGPSFTAFARNALLGDVALELLAGEHAIARWPERSYRELGVLSHAATTGARLTALMEELGLARYVRGPSGKRARANRHRYTWPGESYEALCGLALREGGVALAREKFLPALARQLDVARPQTQLEIHPFGATLGDLQLKKLERLLCYEFQDQRLLRHALNTRGPREESIPSFEHLALLGARAFRLASTAAYLREVPDATSGELADHSAVTLARKHSVMSAFQSDLQKSLPCLMNACVRKEHRRLVALALVGAVHFQAGFDSLCQIEQMLFDRYQSTPEQPPVERLPEPVRSAESYMGQLQLMLELMEGPRATLSSREIQAGSSFTKWIAAVTLGKRKLVNASGQTKEDAEREAAKAAVELVMSEGSPRRH